MPPDVEHGLDFNHQQPNEKGRGRKPALSPTDPFPGLCGRLECVSDQLYPDLKML
jgi:hypothetical protein